MKKIFRCAAIAMLLVPAFSHAQAAPQGWDAEVRQFDQAYWDAYNKCDVNALVAMTADNLEFYHDLGGNMNGKAQFATAMKNNICGNPSARVRREAVADSIHVYPMLANGKLFGALIEGRHQFFNYAAGRAEVPADRGRFTQLLVLKDGKWKVSRVFSYDHLPVQSEQKLPEVVLAKTALEALAGSYKAKDGMPLAVKVVGNHLIVEAGGGVFELYPTSENSFAMNERDMKVAFSVNAAGKGQGLIAREHGVVAVEATATTP